MATINGTIGNDTLLGTADDDIINGLTGSDSLKGGGGADILDGGTAFDTALYNDSTAGVSVNLATGVGLLGSAQGDQLFNIESLSGSNHNDVLTGNDSANALYGQRGADVLIAGDRADQLFGGDGNDILKGGGGEDFLDGGAGIDTADYSQAPSVGQNIGVGVFLSSGGGISGLDALSDDIVNVENVTGSAFNDSLAGNAGVNVLRGLTGDDFLYGEGGDDTLVGGTGSDELVGDEGVDIMIGGAGNDRYFVDNALDQVTENFGEGTGDQVLASASYALAIDSDVESLKTTNRNGTDAINLTGSNVQNTIEGNNGDNIINGRGGADGMFGKAGSDTYFVDNQNDVVVEEAVFVGSDRVLTGVSFVLIFGNSVETLSTDNDAGTAAINLTGNEIANTIIGNAGSNVLDGKGGVDTMSGFGGNDSYRVDSALDIVLGEAAGQGTDNVNATVSYTLAAGLSVETLRVQDALTTNAVNLTANEIANIVTGNAGANVINGGAGADSMRGLGGNDIYVVDNAGDRVTEAVNAGTDLVTTALSIVLGANVENAILTGGANINGFGNALNNSLVGNSGMNVLNGGDGIDQLSGASGNDQLAGGLGNDVLIGGVGKDTFLFHTALNATSNVDTVTDFKVIDDTVRLENAVFTALTATGALNADAFHIGAAAADAEDRIIYNSATGALLYDANGVGGAAGIQFAKLATGLALTNGDFFVA